ncbi:hypothetical protein ALUC_20172S [Aspergillus luchuensis]|nr:hypothetical protein ALUC_20172S [Aspergillus luchuensis]
MNPPRESLDPEQSSRLAKISHIGWTAPRGHNPFEIWRDGARPFGCEEGRKAESNAIENEVAQKHGKMVEHGEQNIMRRRKKAKTSAEKEPIVA